VVSLFLAGPRKIKILTKFSFCQVNMHGMSLRASLEGSERREEFPINLKK
jgi:hypothetical protein